MKSMFPGHYPPTEKEFKELWDNCLFVIDANVLLNMYRYSPDTRTQLFKIFKSISDRLWVPYQAAIEYQTNRLNVIAQQKKAYDDISSALERFRNQLEAKVNEYRRHPYVDSSNILEQVEKTIADIVQDLKKREEKHPDLIHQDNIRDTLTTLLDGKIGQPYTPERLRNICDEGEKRYKHLIPPGYSDAATKDSDKKFGDLILWFQIMEKVKEDKKPVLLITDDTKDDWWWKFNGQVIGPRPELIEELLAETKQVGYLYRSDQFMTYAEKYLEQQVNQYAIDEVRAIRKDDELRMMMILLREEQSTLENKSRIVEDDIVATQRTLTPLLQDLAAADAKASESTQDETSISKLKELKSSIADHHRKLNQLHAEYKELQYQYRDVAQRIDKLSQLYDNLETVPIRRSKRK